MSILGQEQKSKLSNGGKTENNLAALQTSKLHNEYSLDGNPFLKDKPSPTILDPKQPAKKYTDNLPS